MWASPALRTAVAEHQKRFYGLDVDPDHVLVTTGATEAIASAVLALCGPGDEVVTFQPYYDSYAATIALSGATLRAVPLRPPSFAFDPDELRAAFSPRTRVVLVNTPHNPTGTVLCREQLTFIGELAAELDAVIVTDEVYEHMVSTAGARPDGHAARAGRPHADDLVGRQDVLGDRLEGRLGARADRRWSTRCARSSSSSPTSAARRSSRRSRPRWGCPTPSTTTSPTSLARKRDLLVDGLRRAGFTVYPPRGTYFVVTDVAPLGFDDGAAFCWRLPELIGVAAVPVSVFCADPDLGRTLVRFAFCKREEVLAEAVSRLASLRSLS